MKLMQAMPSMKKAIREKRNTWTRSPVGPSLLPIAADPRYTSVISCSRKSQCPPSLISSSKENPILENAAGAYLLTRGGIFASTTSETAPSLSFAYVTTCIQTQLQSKNATSGCEEIDVIMVNWI